MPAQKSMNVRLNDARVQVRGRHLKKFRLPIQANTGVMKRCEGAGSDPRRIERRQTFLTGSIFKQTAEVASRMNDSHNFHCVRKHPIENGVVLLHWKDANSRYHVISGTADLRMVADAIARFLNCVEQLFCGIDVSFGDVVTDLREVRNREWRKIDVHLLRRWQASSKRFQRFGCGDTFASIKLFYSIRKQAA